MFYSPATTKDTTAVVVMGKSIHHVFNFRPLSGGGRKMKVSDVVYIFVFMTLVGNLIWHFITATRALVATTDVVIHREEQDPSFPQQPPLMMMVRTDPAVAQLSSSATDGQVVHNITVKQSSPTMDDDDGVVPILPPRTWDPWPTDKTLCFDPGHKRIKSENPNGTTIYPLSSMAFDYSWMFHRGLVFIKPMKVGGSTASGVNLRISKNMAERLNKTFPFCENNFDHALGYMYRKRNPDKSFLWTLLREPTKRAVSGFWHFRVSREQDVPNIDNFVKEMQDQTHYYIRVHAFKDISAYGSVQDAAKFILQQYNFIALTERFDESMVVLQSLLNVPLGDVLYVSAAKSSGSYDDGGHHGMCVYIQPSNLTTEMREYIQGDEWRRKVEWDEALYKAANESLDMTIDNVIGRSSFDHMLEVFRLAMDVVNERCASELKPPCTGPGYRQPPGETNCLFQDSGCGYECIDRVVQELLSTSSLPPPTIQA